jgi:hypothetical protein
MLLSHCGKRKRISTTVSKRNSQYKKLNMRSKLTCTELKTTSVSTYLMNVIIQFIFPLHSMSTQRIIRKLSMFCLIFHTSPLQNVNNPTIRDSLTGCQLSPYSTINNLKKKSWP